MRKPLPASRGVEHRHCIAREVDEQLLGRPMRLSHGRRDRRAPSSIEVAEPAVAIALGMLCSIFLPQQQQRYAGPLQLSVHMGPVGQRPCRLLIERRRREQPALELDVVHPFRDRPGDANHGSPPQILTDRRSADANSDGDLPFAHAKGVAQS